MQRKQQLVAFLLCAGYFIYSLLRKCLVVCTPWLLQDNTINFSKTELGLLSSYFSLAYGISKCLGSVVTDYSISCNKMFIFGLLGCSVSLALFAYTSSITVMLVLWAFCGFAQGLGISIMRDIT